MLSNRYKRNLENWRVYAGKILDMVGIVGLTHDGASVKGNERKSFLPKQVLIVKWLVIITLSILVSMVLNLGHSYANSTTVDQQDNYKLYAHNKIFNSHEYECYVLLINAESHWNPHVASNHGSYGMVQGQDPRIKKMDAYQQIDWSIAYIHHRYVTTTPICSAWLHEHSKHWY